MSAPALAGGPLSRSRARCLAVPIIATAALAASGGLARADASGAVNPLETAKSAVVMVLAVDFVDGRLVPVASGSGTVVNPNGSILTSFHVLFDSEQMRLRDLFLVGLFRSDDQEPELVCAGKPDHGHHQQEVDLSLIRCHLDMSGRRWLASNWPTIPHRKLNRDDIVPGERVWMLGYPNVGGASCRATAGLVSGWTDEHGGTGSRTFASTDAPITHGYSGGAAIDEHGNFFGIPTAFRTTTVQSNTVFTASKEGLIRPLEDAAALLKIADSDWVPGVPRTDASASSKHSASSGVVVSGRVVDASSGRPVANAIVAVLRPEHSASQLRADELEKATISWSVTDTNGTFSLSPPVPRGARYSLLILSSAHHPLRADGALTVPAEAPNALSPWPSIELRRR